MAELGKEDGGFHNLNPHTSIAILSAVPLQLEHTTYRLWYIALPNNTDWILDTLSYEGIIRRQTLFGQAESLCVDFLRLIQLTQTVMAISLESTH